MKKSFVYHSNEDDHYSKAKEEASNLSPPEFVLDTDPICCFTCEYMFNHLQANESRCLRPNGPVFSLGGDSIYVVCAGWKSNIF